MKWIYTIISVVGVVTILSFIADKVFELFKHLATLPEKMRSFNKALSEKLVAVDTENEAYFEEIRCAADRYGELIKEVEQERANLHTQREEMLRAVGNVFDNLQILSDALVYCIVDI